MNSKWIRDLLMPGIADVESKVPGSQMDLIMNQKTGDLQIIGWRKDHTNPHTEVILTREEIARPGPCREFGPRSLAFAKKLVEET